MLLLLISVFLRTLSILAFVLGISATLYFHPYEANRQTPSNARYLLKEQSSIGGAEEDLKTDDVLSTAIPPRVKAELESFSRQIIKDYICWWYQPPNFADDRRFPDECRASLDRCVTKLYHAFSRKDPVLYFDAIFTNFIALLGAVLEDLRIAYKFKTEDDRMGFKTHVKSNPDAIISRMMDEQERFSMLRRTANVFMSQYAAKSDLQCKPAAEFLRSLLSSSVFDATLKSLAHRDVLNQMLIDALSDRKLPRQSTSDSKETLAAALDLATMQAASATHTMDETMNTMEGMHEQSIVFDEQESDEISPVSTVAQSHTVQKPVRGRRLSFKNKSVGSIADFYDEEGNRVSDKRLSFLKRTGSLLSRSRSRSTSPSKSSENHGTFNQSHNRSRSTSPLKKATHAESNVKQKTTSITAQAHVNLFRAEIIVNDASDIRPEDYKRQINVAPKFSILISPLKQEGFPSAGGIGIFRSIKDVQQLDAQLRPMCNDAVPLIPAWERMSYAMLENELLNYLLQIARDRTLSASDPFKQFCRPDLMSIDEADMSYDSQSKYIETATTLTSNADDEKERLRPHSSHSVKDMNKSGNEPPKSNVEEVRTLRALQKDEALSKEGTSVGSKEDGSLLYETITKSMQPTTIDCSRLDLQNLVSQSMELLTTFYALSSRTWTIRRQLLNVLRNLLLSKNSIYTQAFMDFLETTVLRPFSSADHMATHLRQFNDFMFPAAYEPRTPLSDEASRALAIEARALFVQRGMPSAIRNLMGAPPTAEALGILFDALQDPTFSLGLVSLLFTETFKTLMVD